MKVYHIWNGFQAGAQTPVEDSMSVAFFDADFGLAFIESTDICPRQVLCAPAMYVNSENGIWIVLWRDTLRVLYIAAPQVRAKFLQFPR